jgi:hypothetical protein
MRLPHSHLNDDMRQMALCFCPRHLGCTTAWELIMMLLFWGVDPSAGLRKEWDPPHGEASHRVLLQRQRCVDLWTFTFSPLNYAHCTLEGTAGSERVAQGMTDFIWICGQVGKFGSHTCCFVLWSCVLTTSQLTPPTGAAVCIVCATHHQIFIHSWGYSSELILLLLKCWPELPTKHITSNQTMKFLINMLAYCRIKSSHLCYPVQHHAPATPSSPAPFIFRTVLCASHSKALTVTWTRFDELIFRKSGSHLKILGAEGWMKRVPYWAPTDIGLLRKNLTHPGDLAPGARDCCIPVRDFSVSAVIWHKLKSVVFLDFETGGWWRYPWDRW